MNRYVVVRGLYEISETGINAGNVANYLVVDLTALAVIADCGDMQSRADKVALALNEHDGGAL